MKDIHKELAYISFFPFHPDKIYFSTSKTKYPYFDRNTLHLLVVNGEIGWKC